MEAPPPRSRVSGLAGQSCFPFFSEDFPTPIQATKVGSLTCVPDSPGQFPSVPAHIWVSSPQMESTHEKRKANMGKESKPNENKANWSTNGKPAQLWEGSHPRKTEAQRESKPTLQSPAAAPQSAGDGLMTPFSDAKHKEELERTVSPVKAPPRLPARNRETSLLVNRLTMGAR